MQFERQCQIQMSMSGSSLHQQFFNPEALYSRLYNRLLSFRQINAGTQNPSPATVDKSVSNLSDNQPVSSKFVVPTYGQDLLNQNVYHMEYYTVSK
eukprot:scaffold12918_cov143-Skeletonema_dohrnii-CCMP3373.AAC.2